MKAEVAYEEAVVPGEGEPEGEGEPAATAAPEGEGAKPEAAPEGEGEGGGPPPMDGAHTAEPEPEAPDEMMMRFDRFDVNDNGFLEPKELQVTLRPIRLQRVRYFIA